MIRALAVPVKNTSSAVVDYKGRPEQPIEVAVGVVCRHQQYLLSLRSKDSDQGGLWEFPGGKIELGELPEEALCRELHEELGLRVTQAAPLMSVWHDYRDYQVMLHVFIVDDFKGVPVSREGQAFDWYDSQQLRLLALPSANEAIVAALEVQKFVG